MPLNKPLYVIITFMRTIEELYQFARQELASTATRPVAPTDILYLFDQWPFLQIVNADYASYSEESALNVVRAKTGWDVQDFGDAMATSPGRLLFGGYRHGDEDDESGGGVAVGTIVKQAVDTCYEMIAMAEQKGWGGVLLIDGHPLMQWAAWMHCQQLGYNLQGYEPSAEDYRKVAYLQNAEEHLANYRRDPDLDFHPELII